MQEMLSAALPAASSPTNSVLPPLTPSPLLTYLHYIALGATNVMIPASFFAGVLTFIWPYTRGKAELFTLAVTYGISSGSMVPLMGAPIMALGQGADVGRRTGMYFTIVSLGALAGPPISGAIVHATGGYTAVGIFAGA